MTDKSTQSIAENARKISLEKTALVRDVVKSNLTIKAWDDNPPIILIQNPNTSKELLRIHPDGTVTGSIEDASEAAKVFVDSLRGLLKPSDKLSAAAWYYMSQFGQALDAHGIPYGPSQIEADRNLREALEMCKN